MEVGVSPPTSEDTAIVMYTSGSTGTPKGFNKKLFQLFKYTILIIFCKLLFFRCCSDSQEFGILYAMSNVYVGYCGPNLHCLLAFGTCIGIIV